LKNGLKITVFVVLLAILAVSSCGCASIPIPGSISFPSEIPILNWFL